MVKCPECGKPLKKKRLLVNMIVKACPRYCIDFEKCQFNHDLENCYWCKTCHKHFRLRTKKEFIFR